jgi:rhodanese-related sulfurtransferase
MFWILFIFIQILYMLAVYTYGGEQLITSEDAKKRIARGMRVIDVRTHAEYRAGHYPNSTHIPVNTLTQKTLAGIRKNEPILVYCNTGQRARYAAEKMKRLGYTDVRYIAGSYTTLQ